MDGFNVLAPNRTSHPIGSLLLLALLSAPPRALAADVCASMSAAHVFVTASDHRLYLCRESKTEASFDVRLGSGGLGKTREGDEKTPAGTYPLGAPRPSKQYGVFIPIGYPTPDQRRRGYTGGAVGVHGPDRRVRWLGHLVNTFDTTNGCVGIATDAEMERIAAWVRQTHAATIAVADRPG